MSIAASQYIFDGILCDTYNLRLCSFEDNGGLQTSSAGSTIELTTAKHPHSNKWARYNAQYSAPIEFTIQVMKTDGSEIDALEQEYINRWMIRRDDYKWFQFGQTDYMDIFFNVQVTESNILSVGNRNIGMSFKCVTDSPFGYSEIKTNTYVFTNGNYINHIDQSSEIGYLYPTMEITIATAGTFGLTNAIDDNRLFKIDNCTVGEVITVDCENKIITSTKHTHALYDDFNYNFFRFANTFSSSLNRLTATGDATVKFTYRLPRKVGI